MINLVEQVQSLLEQLYNIDLDERARDFLINKNELENFLVKESPVPKEILLVRKPQDDTVELALYLDHHLMDNLANNNPFISINEKNLSDFCILIEGVSHFVYYLSKARKNRPITQLELELQAEVDKFLMLYCYLRTDKNPQLISKLFDALFEDFKLMDSLSTEACERYITASNLASRFCYQLQKKYGLPNVNFSQMIQEARNFYDLSQEKKINLIFQ